MFSYFLPKHVRQGRNFLKDARKLLAYKRDILTPAQRDEFEGGLERVESALKSRDRAGIESAAKSLDQFCTRAIPVPTEPGIRENVEVFLVAIVIALAVRTYFLQPFTIPTGSMQPTLNGLIGYPQQEPPPNALVRAFHLAAFGRTYVNVVAERECQIVNIREFKSPLPFVSRLGKSGFFTRTEIVTDHSGSYVVNEASAPVAGYLLKPPGHTYKAGEPIARGYIDTGDHVFVDKFSYHFRNPRRSDVFVFNTLNVPTIENRRNPGGPSQFYIKRLVGTPGDTLRVDPPQLFVNGELIGDSEAIARWVEGRKAA